MIVGHFAVGLILKRVDKSLPSGLLFIATQLSDIIFGFTSLVGIEKINIVPGINAATSIEYTFYPYSHSLLATLIWAALIALIFLIVPVKSSLSKSKTALVMATAVLSHFLLDFIVHNPDLDILGNGAYKIGLGLWNYTYVSYAVESLLLLAGLLVYLRSTKSSTLSGKYGMPALTIILLILSAVVTFMSAPSSVQTGTIMLMAIYLSTIAAAFWLDRKRT
jgi:uncharacterized membrane protein